MGVGRSSIGSTFVFTFPVPYVIVADATQSATLPPPTTEPPPSPTATAVGPTAGSDVYLPVAVRRSGLGPGS